MTSDGQCATAIFSFLIGVMLFTSLLLQFSTPGVQFAFFGSVRKTIQMNPSENPKYVENK